GPRGIRSRQASRDSICGAKISSSGKSSDRLSSAGRWQKGGCVMAASTTTAQLPTRAPALSSERPVTWPKVTKARLANGLEVVLAESPSIPKFHGQLSFGSASAAAISRGLGLAEMTATVLRTGTAKRSSRQIEEGLRRLGADLSSSAGSDTS